MNRNLRKIVSLLLCLSIAMYNICCIPYAKAEAESYSVSQTEKVINGIINWKKLQNGSSVDKPLINSKFLELAGTTPGDWFPIGIGRYGYSDDYQGYLSVIADKVSKRYRQPEKLSSSKATEWHRISLAILAMGGDPTSIGKDTNGKPIDLIADGTYNRGKTASLGKQGINGWIWGLITLDSMRYPVPNGAFSTRNDIIIEILSRQLPDGGFALMGKISDPDISAMALQALAPYYNSNHKYTYKLKSGSVVTKTVKNAVDETLTTLSKMQDSDGGFSSWGMKNVESACQVLIALCSLGINPETDSRFIKNDKNIIDNIMTFRMSDGGFTHSYVADSDNPTSIPNKSNSMASEQTLCCFVSLYRYKNHISSLYDFRSQSSKSANAVKSFSASGSKTSIDNADNSHTSNTSKQKSLSSIEQKTPVPVLFTDTDKKFVDSLPTPLTTQEYPIVVKLLDKINKSQDFKDKDKYTDKLKQAKDKISDIQKEIDLLNKDITQKISPCDKISINDKDLIYDIFNRYNNLSPYDQSKILHYDDLLKTKTQVDNIERSIIIFIIIAATAAVCTIIIIYRIRIRRKKKMLAKNMPEENDYPEEKS